MDKGNLVRFLLTVILAAILAEVIFLTIESNIFRPILMFVAFFVIAMTVNFKSKSNVDKDMK
ncbi:hypothetical protein QA612_13635 [Evansella sp. AB-P1]|uniref:hypothetical protein n=1 Tax=Evansella sp. AB-P1 TaxID=3037653 RepID=UPI00241D6FE1|nr:hypothetical protein [Evansella sp. AB-P1]MDG5788523.1 hypothetical protein [Evansella sp. AB-P1]